MPELWQYTQLNGTGKLALTVVRKMLYCTHAEKRRAENHQKHRHREQKDLRNNDVQINPKTNK